MSNSFASAPSEIVSLSTVHDNDEAIPSILEPDGASRELRKNWARLTQKIYEVNPPTCPKCSGTMKVISAIEDENVIKKILQRRTSPQASWALGHKDQASAQGHYVSETIIDYSQSQLPLSDDYIYYDEMFPIEDSDFSGEALSS